MKPLIISVAGVRGVVGESITPEVLARFASAYGTFVKGGKVVVGTDSRLSREMCRYAVLGALLSVGCQVIDLGICPTPTIRLMVENLKVRGGLVITASHNPAEWSGLKFLTEEGTFLNARQWERLLSIYHGSKINRVPFYRLGRVKENSSALSTHIKKLLSYLNVDLIRKKRFRVALDCANGAGSVITPIFLRRLGCRVLGINCQVDEVFPHPPEPIPQNLSGLIRLIKKKGADLGFAQDADADRLAIVSEKGFPLGEEYSVALSTQFVLRNQKKKGTVVVNLSTTRAIDDIAQRFGSRVVRTRVGEIYVVEGMKRHRAVIGGEGNGGVIDPRAHYGRDSLAGMGIILQYLAESGESISRLAESIPRYYLLKRKVRCPEDKKEKFLEAIKKEFAEERLDQFRGKSLTGLDLRDGVKAIWEDAWVQVRPSGTEPAIRVFAEARTRTEARKIANSILMRIRRM
ncbi:phosphoglucosamine mutase [candidate division NPL-UPA2 bacterium]|nr:phosphoglucosamine mutase [candidate division NPL-UPA2 bacterium]